LIIFIICWYFSWLTFFISLSYGSSWQCQVHFSGRKWQDKFYRWHTGYPGGLKERNASDMVDRKPDFILRKAILGMLSRTNLRHKYIEPRLRIYDGPKHPHSAQLPDEVKPLKIAPRRANGENLFGQRAYSDKSVPIEGPVVSRLRFNSKN